MASKYPLVLNGTQIEELQAGDHLPSSLITFNNGLSGGVTRQLVLKLNDKISVKDFGVIGDGTTDDTTALQAALTYAITNNIRLLFPAGSYKITNNITITFPSTTSILEIEGDGSVLSKIISPSGNGIILNFISMFNAVRVKGLSVVGGAANTGTAFLITQTVNITNPADCTLSIFDDVSIYGSSSSNFFQTAISINGASCFNFKSVSIYGNTSGGYAGLNCGYGIVFQGLGSGYPIPVQFNIESCILNFLTVGVYYGNYVQGVQISLTNFTGCNWGILSPVSATNTNQLSVIGNQFNCTSRAILIQSLLVNVMIANNAIFVQDNVIGIDVTYASGLVMLGNAFNYEGTGASTNGIAVQSTYNGSITPNNNSSVITGNSFYGLSTGVWIWAGCTGLRCFGNSFSQISVSNVYDQGVRSILGKPLGLTSVNSGTNTTATASVSFTPPTTGTLKVIGIVNYQDLGTTAYNSTLTVAGAVVQQLASKMSTTHTWDTQVSAGTAITSTIAGQSSWAFTVEISMLFTPDI